MKTDLTKPHIYINGVAINEKTAKAAPEMLEVLKRINETYIEMMMTYIELDPHKDRLAENQKIVIKLAKDTREIIEKAKP